MNPKRIIGRTSATTVQELIQNLKDLSPDHDTTYVTINSDSVYLTLVEETLTDGSVVYNIELSEVCK